MNSNKRTSESKSTPRALRRRGVPARLSPARVAPTDVGSWKGIPKNWRELVSTAASARERAYVPYSGFAVGAAVECVDGKVFSGCNVENISFGLTNCAERVAIQSAVGAGFTRIIRIVIISDSKHTISPCGACRQVMSEFSHDLQVLSVNLLGRSRLSSLRSLLPHPADGILG